MQQHYTAAVSRVQLLCHLDANAQTLHFLFMFFKSESLSKVCRIFINTSVYLEFCKLKAEYYYKQTLRNFLWQQLTARITILRVFVKYYSRLVVVFYRNAVKRLLDAIFATTMVRRRKWRFFINAWETISDSTCVSTAANRLVKFAWLFARVNRLSSLFRGFCPLVKWLCKT